MVRNKIWNGLINSKLLVLKLDALVIKYQVLERWINIILALASSASISAWAIWQMYPTVWASIIAITNIVATVKPFFPFSKYVKELIPKYGEAKNILLEYELLWYKHENQQVTEDIAFETHIKLQKGINTILQFSEDVIISGNPKLDKHVQQRLNVYLENEFELYPYEQTTFDE